GVRRPRQGALPAGLREEGPRPGRAARDVVLDHLSARPPGDAAAPAAGDREKLSENLKGPGARGLRPGGRGRGPGGGGQEPGAGYWPPPSRRRFALMAFPPSRRRLISLSNPRVVGS